MTAVITTDTVVTTKVERDFKIAKISLECYVQQKVEILIALRQLGDSLEDQEIDFLQKNASDALKEFERVTDEQGINLSVAFLVSPIFSRLVTNEVVTSQLNKTTTKTWSH